jgi:hypothetical protein
VSDLCSDNDWSRVAGVQASGLEARVSDVGASLRCEFHPMYVCRLYSTIQFNPMLNMGITNNHIMYSNKGICEYRWVIRHVNGTLYRIIFHRAEIVVVSR